MFLIFFNVFKFSRAYPLYRSTHVDTSRHVFKVKINQFHSQKQQNMHFILRECILQCSICLWHSTMKKCLCLEIMFWREKSYTWFGMYHF